MLATPCIIGGQVTRGKLASVPNTQACFCSFYIALKPYFFMCTQFVALHSKSIRKQASSLSCMLMLCFGGVALPVQRVYGASNAAKRTHRQVTTVTDNQLIRAIEANDSKKILGLIRSRYNVDNRDFLGYSPLHHAAKLGHVHAVSLLIQANALLDQTSFKSHHTPLALAIIAGHKQIVSRLLDAGAQTAILNANGYNALHLAIQCKRTELVSLLLQSGCSSNLPTQDGISPLLLAIRTRKTAMVQCLLARKDLRPTQDPQGYTELHWALKQNQPNIFKLLVKSGKWNLDAQAQNGVTLLHLLAANPNSHPKFLQCLKQVLLLNVHAQDVTGSTALHYAAANNQLKILIFLLHDLGIDPNIQNNAGQTALHYAVQYGHVAIVKKLLTCSQASVTVKNKAGITSLELSMRSKNPAIYKLFGAHKSFVGVS